MIKFINRKWADPEFSFIALLLLALGTISAAVVTPTILEAQARKQCLNHDWPAHQHQNHVKFCQYNGYELGKLGPGY